MGESPPVSTISGKLPTALANEISDAINRALRRGMEADEACCIAAAVIADYARDAYGDGYLPNLATIMRLRAGQSLPRKVRHG